MSGHQHASVTMIRHVAEHLGDLREQVVFLGGAVTGLLLTDPAAPEARFTEDVDVVISVGSYPEYARLEDVLRRRGFTNVRDVICRWNIAGVVVDIMPTDPAVLGFSNRWYAAAMQTAAEHSIAPSLSIRLITAPVFIATKLEAFGHPSRQGHGDYLLSRDLADIITVVDGRREIVSEVAGADVDVPSFLAQAFRRLLQNADFLDALPGHLPPDAASQQRLPLLTQRLLELGGLP